MGEKEGIRWVKTNGGTEKFPLLRKKSERGTEKKKKEWDILIQRKLGGEEAISRKFSPNK